MKNLMIISFLLLGSCSVSLDTPENFLGYYFPEEWQGYYTKVSLGDKDLPKEFKVSDKYMSYKDTSRYAEHDDFCTYQIEEINKKTSTEFSFDPKDAYADSEWGTELYYFKKISSDQIEVEKFDILLFMPNISKATYKRSDIPQR